MKLKTASDIKKLRLKKNFKVCGVYFIFDGDEIVYVGKSVNIFVRVNSHRFKWDSFSFIEVKEGRTQLDLEHKYIMQLRPKHNKASKNMKV